MANLQSSASRTPVVRMHELHPDLDSIPAEVKDFFCVNQLFDLSPLILSSHFYEHLFR